MRVARGPGVRDAAGGRILATYAAKSRVPSPSARKSQSYEKRAAISAPSGGPTAKPPFAAKRVRAKLWRRPPSGTDTATSAELAARTTPEAYWASGSTA